MRRATWLLALTVLGTGLLSACQISVEPLPPPEPDVLVTARNDTANPVRTITVAPRATVLVQVDIDTTLPLVYIEAESSPNLNLEVLSANRSRIASSSGPAFFASGRSGLLAADVEPQQVVETALECRGSCVIVERGERTRLFARIHNPTSGSVSVALYAFGDIYQDTAEPGNDSRGGATPYAVGATAQGAIETVGDVDYWIMQGPGWVEFVAENRAVDIVADLYTAGGALVATYESGDQFQVLAGQYLVVSAVGGRAAPSADSVYTLVNGNP